MFNIPHMLKVWNLSHYFLIICYIVTMQFSKEFIHETRSQEKRHMSSRIIEAEPFRSARVKQGGYGLHEDDFWLWRTSKRGFHVIVLTLSGHGFFRMEDGTELHTGKGEAFISWATGQGHFEKTIGPEPWEMIWMTFWSDSAYLTPSSADYEIRSFSGIDELRSNTLNVFKEELYQDSLSNEALELYEKIMLINMSRSLSLSENSMLHIHRQEFADLWIKVSKQLDRKWTIEDLCRESGYSRSHLTRLFLDLYGKNPGQMLKELKMTQAKVLLINSVQSIESIASEVGYDSVSVFSNAFRNYFGQSPREFRKANSLPEFLKMD